MTGNWKQDPWRPTNNFKAFYKLIYNTKSYAVSIHISMNRWDKVTKQQLKEKLTQAKKSVLDLVKHELDQNIKQITLRGLKHGHKT